MKKIRTCPAPIDGDLGRRGFLKRALTVSAAEAAGLGLEEQTLRAAATAPGSYLGSSATLPAGKIDNDFFMIEFAFGNGADFACVGMFDWQIAEDVEIANAALARHRSREHAWLA